MKGIRHRFLLWAIGWIALFLLANLQLRPFPHILILFWTLLPILSLAISLFSGKLLHLEESVTPHASESGEGTWICELTNDSSLMAFFLRFRELPLKKKHGSKPLELMLQPKEKRNVELSFHLPYTGSYSLRSKEPTYEDLLGFFHLRFFGSKNKDSVECCRLPEEIEWPGLQSEQKLLDEIHTTVERRALMSVTDDVFSVDPLTNGESLAHAHWKLSARLQQWMIRHYSDYESVPLRIIVDTKSISASPDVRFDKMKNPVSDPATEKDLQDRTDFLNLVYTFGLQILRNHATLEYATPSEQISRFRSEEEISDFQLTLASIPFQKEQSAWKLSYLGENKQLIFVQQFDDFNYGSLLHQCESSVPFLCISVRSMNTPEMMRRVEQSPLECIWIEEESDEGKERKK